MMIGFAPSLQSWPPATDFVESKTPVVICDPEDEDWTGTQPIETIQEGDYVLSKDELSGQLSCEQVSSPISMPQSGTIIPDQEIFGVRLRNSGGESSQINATGNHPFFANGEWTRVDELGPGDVVQSRGEDLEVVEVVRTQRFETVYNFTVSNHHTYFVGENAAWVHNIQICDDVAKEIAILRDAATKKGNYNLGEATVTEANKLGQAWVGEGARVSKNGKALVSKDGFRIYRPPAAKANSPYAKTGIQANFERKIPGSRQAMGNGHLDIFD